MILQQLRRQLKKHGRKLAFGDKKRIAQVLGITYTQAIDVFRNKAGERLTADVLKTVIQINNSRHRALKRILNNKKAMQRKQS